MEKHFVCRRCGEYFDEFMDCVNHEKNCGNVSTFKCYKCGKEISWNNNDVGAIAIENRCHYINLGRMGYGSELDGCDIEFQLCDDCLVEFINTLKLKDNIYNSGSNYYEESPLSGYKNNNNVSVNKKCIKSKCVYYFSTDNYAKCQLNPSVYLKEDNDCIGIDKVDKLTEELASKISKIVMEMQQLSTLEEIVKENQSININKIRE